MAAGGDNDVECPTCAGMDCPGAPRFKGICPLAFERAAGTSAYFTPERMHAAAVAAAAEEELPPTGAGPRYRAPEIRPTVARLVYEQACKELCLMTEARDKALAENEKLRHKLEWEFERNEKTREALVARDQSKNRGLAVESRRKADLQGSLDRAKGVLAALSKYCTAPTHRWTGDSMGDERRFVGCAVFQDQSNPESRCLPCEAQFLLLELAEQGPTKR